MRYYLFRFRWLDVFLVLILLALVVLASGYAFWGYVGFDEAFNLQVPVSLAERTQYTTTWDQARPFDPYISLGPTVLIPIAILFKIFGVGIIQARWVMFLYFLLFLFVYIVILTRLSGKLAAVLTLLFFASLPSVYEIGLKVMGEVPATGLFLLGVLAYGNKRPLCAGLLFGVAILTKQIFLVSLIAIGLMFIFELIVTIPKKTVILFHSWLAAGGAIPLFSWELLRYIALGKSGYLQLLTDLQQISKLLYYPPANAYSFREHIKTLVMPFGNPLVWIGLLVWFFVLTDNFSRFTSEIRKKPTDQIAAMGLLLTLSCAAFLGWWFIGTSLAWWRHLLPAYLIFAILVGISIAQFMKSRPRDDHKKVNEQKPLHIIKHGVTIFAILIIILQPLGLQILRMPVELRHTYTDQLELAEYIRSRSNQNSLFAYWGWFQAPELSFLSQVKFYDAAYPPSLEKLKQRSGEGYPVYVIVANVQKVMAPSTLEQEQNILGKLIKKESGYWIYKFRNK